MVNFGVWSDATWFKNIFVQLNVSENSDRLLPSLSLSFLTYNMGTIITVLLLNDNNRSPRDVVRTEENRSCEGFATVSVVSNPWMFTLLVYVLPKRAQMFTLLYVQEKYRRQQRELW